MPEVADVFRRFGGSYLAAHGAGMLPSHRRALARLILPRPARGARGAAVVWQGRRRPAARLPFLPQPRLPEVSRRADAGLARTASGGDVTGAPFPRHRHRTPGTAGRAAPR